MVSRRDIRTKLLYIFPIIIIFQSFSLLWGWIPQTKLPYFLYLGLLIGMVSCSKYFINSRMLVLLVYLFVLYVNFQSGDPWWNSISKVVTDFVRLLLTGLIGYAMLTFRDQKIIKLTVVSFLLMIIINAIGTTFVETIVPGSIRTLTEMERWYDDNSIWFYYRYGLANYFLPSALVTLIPIMVMGIKANSANKRKRLFFIFALFASMMLIYYSGSTAALLLGVTGFLVSIFFRFKSSRKQWWGVAVVVIVLSLFLSNDNLTLSFLRIFDSFVGYQGFFHDKIDDFESLILYGETSGDIEVREGLYTDTWNAIIQDPFFGTNKSAGSHSLLLDHWGYLGLVGFIPYLIFIFLQIKLSSNYIPLESKPFYFISVLFTFIMMLAKNMDSWETWLCLFTILPLLAVYSLSGSGKKRIV